MLNYQEEDFMKFYSDAAQMLFNHNAEINLFDDKLEINFKSYMDAEERGSLKIFTARAREELVGYAAFSIYRHPHHARIIHANQDVLYVKPEYRGIGGTLIDYADLQLKHSDVKVVHHSVPKVSKDFGIILKRKGYRELETIYARRL